MSASIHLSRASPPLPDYLPDFLRLFDEATVWLVSRGRTGQWGVAPPSTNPGFIEYTANLLDNRDMTMVFARARSDTPILGILAFNETPTPGGSTPVAREREVYVHLLLTTRDPVYRGLGARLLDEAKGEARRKGIGLMRLSCYAGEGGGLIDAYEKMGFRRNPKEIFKVPNWAGGGPWPKVVMEMEVSPEGEEEEEEGVVGEGGSIVVD